MPRRRSLDSSDSENIRPNRRSASSRRKSPESSSASVSTARSDLTDEWNSKEKTSKKKGGRSKSRRRTIESSDEEEDGGKSTDKGRSNRRAKEESDEEDDVLLNSIRKSIRDKLLSNGGKKLRVLSAAFRKVDEEGHGFITKDQFKSIVSTRMSKKNNKFDKDEIRWLCNNLKGRKRNSIVYEKLKDVITDGEVYFDEDGDADDAWKGFSSENWAVRNGSVGEWLQNVATPQDRRNFKDFMSMLDNFERARGMDSKRSLEMQGNAVVVKLGPMMSVAMKFFVE
ncbi:hypothetical protein TrCOL_g6086 [Triparma columacea]|uniref:EF-hand domain-containing protein n=1 Tax=Triparma columacea TaxID=722753 RepID=A0A9W7FYR8_9STRA|nr:hypothetical protein TrCOL_g6086 [Triparma columacea]